MRLAFIASLFFCLAGCASSPLAQARMANVAFASTLTTATVLHEGHEISDGAYAAIQASAQLARPALDELNRKADQYDAAQKRGATAPELAAIRFNAGNVWRDLEPKLLDLADQLIAAQRKVTTRPALNARWPLPRGQLAA